MIDVVPFKAEHALLLDPQPEQGYEVVLPEDALERERDDAWTLLEDGLPIACGGVDASGWTWGLLSSAARRRMLVVHTAVRRMLSRYAGQRLTLYADVEFEAAHQWARLLGFHPAGATKIRPGKDATIYQRG